MTPHAGKRSIATALLLPIVIASVLAATQSRDAFEVVSVKPMPGSAAAGGARGGNAPGGADAAPTLFQSYCTNLKSISPRRLVLTNATVYDLIALAYNEKCLLLSGGPEWTRVVRFEVQAVLPEGTPTYTIRQLQDGEAPRLQAMLQTLLAERFKLAFHREARDTAVYNLVVSGPGKYLKPSVDQNPPDPPPYPAFLKEPRRGPGLGAAAIPISRLASLFSAAAGRLVIDKTNLKGLFDVRVDYDAEYLAGDPFNARFTAVQEQLGLKLESARASVAFLVIDRVERPTVN